MTEMTNTKDISNTPTALQITVWAMRITIGAARSLRPVLQFGLIFTQIRGAVFALFVSKPAKGPVS